MKKHLLFIMITFLSAGVSQYVCAAAAAEDVEEQRQKQLGQQLIVAINRGEVEEVRRLIGLGAPVNYQGRFRFTPLYAAIKLPEYRSIVKILLDAKADANQATGFGITPLMEAIVLRKLYAAKELIDAGADVNMLDKQGDTPLIYAVKCCAGDIVRLLILAGANLDTVNKEGNSAWTTDIEYHQFTYIPDSVFMTRAQMTELMQQAIEERERRTQIISGMVKKHLPIEGVMDIVSRGYLGRQRSVPTQADLAEKEEEEREHTAAAPIEESEARVRRLSRAAAGTAAVGRRGSFYGSAEEAAERTRAERAEAGLRPGEVPQPNEQTGFWD